MTDDKIIIGSILAGVLYLFIMLSMAQTPDTSDAIYYVNFTSGNNSNYTCIDYLLINVSVNDTTIIDPTGIRIDLYYANETLKENRTGSGLNLFANFTDLNYGVYYFNATVTNGTHNFSTNTYKVNLSKCNYTMSYLLGYPFKLVCTPNGQLYQPIKQNSTRPTFNFTNNEPFNLTVSIKLRTNLPTNFTIYSNNTNNSTLAQLNTTYSLLNTNLLNYTSMGIWLFGNCSSMFNTTGMPNMTIKVVRNG